MKSRTKTLFVDNVIFILEKKLILHGGEENVKWERNEISQEDNVTYWCNQEDATYEILVLRKK